MDRKNGSSSISENLAAYQGRWVAEIGGKVVGQGGTKEQALQSAKAARRKETPTVRFIQPGTGLILAPIIERVREILPADRNLYLVGGAVRDALLKKESCDLDFCTGNDAIKLARKIANALNGAFYRLDQEHGAGRVVLNDEEQGRIIMDFAPFNGDSLEEDLFARDFTINAIAVDIRKSDEILDPTGGAADLAAGRIRACSSTSLKDDPVRAIRAVRFATRFQMQIEPQTLQWVKEAVPGLVDVSIERKRDEFFKILGGRNPTSAIRIQKQLGMLEYVLPEVVALYDFPQLPPHIYDVWEHSLQTVKALENILQVLETEYDEDAASQMHLGLIVLHLGRYRNQISACVKNAFVLERPLKAMLLMGALLHDVGKPVSYKETDQYVEMFVDHDILGADIAKKTAGRMRLSRKESRFLAGLVENHLAITRLTKTDGPLTRKQIYHFFRKNGELAVPVILLNIADIIGAYGPGLQQEKLNRYLEISRQIMDALFEAPEKTYSPDLLLTGQDLMELFDLEPGPQIGQMLEALQEAQVVEGINNRSAAIAYLRALAEE